MSLDSRLRSGSNNVMRFPNGGIEFNQVLDLSGEEDK